MFDRLHMRSKPGFFVMVVVGSEILGVTCRTLELRSGNIGRVVPTAKNSRHENMLGTRMVPLDDLTGISTVESVLMIPGIPLLGRTTR
jgi:hypothetical protein